MNAYPKILALGSKYIVSLFEDDVYIEEKVDGSQTGFGIVDGEFYMRSKSQQLFKESVDKMFKEGYDYLESKKDVMPEGVFFYAEYLRKPRHNTLNYEKIPKNHFMLFGVKKGLDDFVSDRKELQKYADLLDIDLAPLLKEGKASVKDVEKLLETDSYLGGPKVEGVVIKNYSQSVMLGGHMVPIMLGKFVSEKFKEKHSANWNREHKSKGKWAEFIESFCTEARWEKAVQHLKEAGQLEEDPRDIGKLIIEVQKDIGEEHKDDIKTWLWKYFGKDLLRKSTAGLPEWYKKKLAGMDNEEKA